MKGKIQYHLRSKQASVDKSNPQILTSSPAVEVQKSKSKLTDFLLDKNLNLDDVENELLLQENTSFRNTIQSMNEKDNVNYLVESSSNNEEAIFRTALKKTKKLGENVNLIEDKDNKYVESSNKLLETISNCLDYFKKINEVSFKNEEKPQIVRILKSDYENLRKDYESLVLENKRLKEKNKMLKENSTKNYTSMDNSGVNINKLIDSMIYLQTKNEEVEKENKFLKSELEKTKEKLRSEKKKRNNQEQNSQSSYKSKFPSKTSQSTLGNKSEQMEILLKEQISCMKKMLIIVQDKKDNTTTSSKKKSELNEFEDSDQSNIHFEESFNVTNMSVDYSPDGGEVVQSSDKDYENKNSSIGYGQKFEIMLKPFEKPKKKEHAVDDERTNQNVKNKEMSKDPQSAKTKINNLNFANYSKFGKKIDLSHRVLNK